MKLKCIIIDDEPMARKILQEFIEEIDYLELTGQAENPLKAVSLLNNNDIDIIFLDINMPKINGIELKDKIQTNENLKLKCIPYLFFTTSANQQHVIDAYSKSVQGFFVKPFDFDRLTIVIKKIVEYWQECESPNYVK